MLLLELGMRLTRRGKGTIIETRGSTANVDLPSADGQVAAQPWIKGRPVLIL